MAKVARALVGATGVCTLVVSALSGLAVAAEPVATTPNVLPSTGIVAAPVRVAATADGAVSYREIGSGSPLLLIMGLGGTMNDWSPSFVNALAARHKVVVFDNAGVGKTAGLAPPLSVTAMAKQTSALISALHLAPTAVLGWSMGGMIAQALAVQHASQVSRLVLAATQAGDGKAVAPAAAGVGRRQQRRPQGRAERPVPTQRDRTSPALRHKHSSVPSAVRGAARRQGGAGLRYRPVVRGIGRHRARSGLAEGADSGSRRHAGRPRPGQQ